MRKYHITICKCGHIHAIPNDKIEAAIEANKNFLLICGSCGEATLIGADIETDMFDETMTVYSMYTCNFKGAKDTVEITSEIFSESSEDKAISEIYYDVGIPVLMKTGYYANMYMTGSGFSDTRHPDFTELTHKHNITSKDVREFIDKYLHDSNTVNMNCFINNTDPEILTDLSNYMIDGLCWKGTKYEKEWH